MKPFGAILFLTHSMDKYQPDDSKSAVGDALGDAALLHAYFAATQQRKRWEIDGQRPTLMKYSVYFIFGLTLNYFRRAMNPMLMIWRGYWGASRPAAAPRKKREKLPFYLQWSPDLTNPVLTNFRV